MTHIYMPKSEWHRQQNLLCRLPDLTAGKAYDCTLDEDEIVYSSDGIYYDLTNDKGIRIGVHESHLIPIQEWREKKLNEIGI